MNPIQDAIQSITEYCLCRDAINRVSTMQEKQIKIFVTNIVLREVEQFIKETIPLEKRTHFLQSLTTALEKKDSAAYTTLLLQYLMTIPHYQYLLEGRMNGVKVTLLQQLQCHPRESGDPENNSYGFPRVLGGMTNKA